MRLVLSEVLPDGMLAIDDARIVDRADDFAAGERLIDVDAREICYRICGFAP